VRIHPEEIKPAGHEDVSATFKKMRVGMEIEIVQAGIPDAIPVEACGSPRKYPTGSHSDTRDCARVEG
jgi:hypothetical protein